MTGSIPPDFSTPSDTVAAFTLAGAAAAAGTVVSRMMGVFSSANTGASASAEPLTPERVFSHSDILTILKREDVLANPNSPVQEWGMPPLLKIAELLVQFHSSTSNSLIFAGKWNAVEGLKPLLKSSEPSIAAAAKSCMDTLNAGVHEKFPDELEVAAKKLIDQGADPFAPGADGESALQKAATVSCSSFGPSVLLTMAHPRIRKLTISDVDQLSIPSDQKGNKTYLYTIAFINAVEAGEDISAFGPLFDRKDQVPSILKVEGLYKDEPLLTYALQHSHIEAIKFLGAKGLKLEGGNLSSLTRISFSKRRSSLLRHLQISGFFEIAAQKEDIYLFGALLGLVDDPAKREKECRLFDERTANSERVRNKKIKQRDVLEAISGGKTASLPPEVLDQIGKELFPPNLHSTEGTGADAADA